MIHALRYTEELEKVGFSTEQAKKSVQVWMELMDQNFATKADFKEHYFMTKNDTLELRSEFKKDCKDIIIYVDKRFVELESRMDKRFSEIDKRFDKLDRLEDKLTIKLGIMMAASIGVVSTIVALIK